MERQISRKEKKNIQKRNYLIILFTLTFVLFALFFKVIQLSMTKSVAAEETIISSEIYPGLNLKTTTQETDTFTLFISQPYIKDEKMNNQIEAFINQEKQNFITEYEDAESMLKKNGFRGHLNIQTSTEKIADKIYNIELETYKTVGGANGTTTVQPILMDLNTNELLKINDLFELDEASVAEIKNLVFEEAENNPDVSDLIFEDLFNEAMSNPDEWKVLIHPESVTFFFDEYEIAAGAAGVIQLKIPMEKIIYYFNSAFAEKVNLEIPKKEVKLSPDGKYIALTFDDGPHAEVTPRVLETLEQHGAKATFYMLGSQVEYYPDIAKQVFDEGHELGDHTMSHKDLTHLSADQIKNEIETSSHQIEHATGNLPKSLRPPYGAFNDTVGAISNDLGLPVIMWSVDSLDWKSRNAEAINQKVMATVHPGAIVLLHDIHATTADALPQLLTNLEREGYEFVTVSQLLEFGELEGIGPHHGINQ